MAHMTSRKLRPVAFTATRISSEANGFRSVRCQQRRSNCPGASNVKTAGSSFSCVNAPTRSTRDFAKRPAITVTSSASDFAADSISVTRASDAAVVSASVTTCTDNARHSFFTTRSMAHTATAAGAASVFKTTHQSRGSPFTASAFASFNTAVTASGVRASITVIRRAAPSVTVIPAAVKPSLNAAVSAASVPSAVTAATLSRSTANAGRRAATKNVGAVASGVRTRASSNPDWFTADNQPATSGIGG